MTIREEKVTVCLYRIGTKQIFHIYFGGKEEADENRPNDSIEVMRFDAMAKPGPKLDGDTVYMLDFSPAEPCECKKENSASQAGAGDTVRQQNWAVLCALEEMCHAITDVEGPFVCLDNNAVGPNGEVKTYALPWDNSAVRRLLYRVRDEARSRFGKAQEWEPKTHIELKKENARLYALSQRPPITVEMLWPDLSNNEAWSPSIIRARVARKLEELQK